MKKTIMFFMLIAIATVSCKVHAPQRPVAEEVPLIDREIFFGTPEITGAQLSPDGKWVSFMKEYNGIINIWVKPFDEKFENARPLTNNERPIGGYFWTIDSKNILFVKDNKGDENYNIYAVNPQGAAEQATGVPVSRNLTPMKNVVANIYNVSEKNPDVLWVGINDRDKSWHNLYKLTISTGKLEKLYENKNRITGWDFDRDEKLRLAYRTDEKGNSTIMLVDNDFNFTNIYETNVKEQAYVAGWNKDNSRMYLVSNKGDVDLTTLYEMDPASRMITKLESDPRKRVDLGGMFQDKHTGEIIYTLYMDEKEPDIYWRNKDWESMYTYLQSKFPGRQIGFGSMTDDYRQILVNVSGDKYASETYYFNRDTKELIHQYTPRPKLKAVEKYLVSMEPIRYKSSDGLEIPAYLTIPYGREAKNLPLVVIPHGGPKGPRDYWGFNSYAQILANRGYAVMTPNFRASGGYGKSFLNAGDKQWGKLMQDDITYGVKYLIDQGIADPNRVAIMGGSYGGYATLAGLAFTPDLYAAGVDIVGPSNLFTLLESIPPYWEAARVSLYEMVGDPSTEEGTRLMREASPLFSVDKIKKPLLIVQGANDPRVNQAESDQIVIALRDKGLDVKYILADDEGHGFAKPVNNMAMWASIEEFLAKHIGGRYQSTMTDEVSKRLGELTQDVNKVVYVPKKEVAVSETLPTLAGDLMEGTHKYNVNMEVQGQTLNMEVVRTIKKEGDQWVIVDATNSPMGSSTDASYLKDMVPVKRVISQGGQNIVMVVEGGNVVTSMIGKDNKVPYTGAMLLEGAGIDMLLARFPLKEVYKTSYQTFDLMTNKLKTRLVEVVAKEGNLFKMVVTDSDNSNEKVTYYIDPMKKIAAKVEQNMPALGNAKVTMTLK